MAKPLPTWFDQEGFRLRFGWGPNGLRRLAPVADVVVIVDVLSFSTSVDVALGRGATILPYRWHDGSEQAHADEHDAAVAQRVGPDGEVPDGYTLRPSSLVAIEPGVRLVLPSPNGSALTFGAAEAASSRPDTGTAERTVLVGCLRNATAVGRAAAELAGASGVIAMIGAGERWRGAIGPLRPAVEDLLGAGAILGAAADTLGTDVLSPESAAARAAYRDAAPEVDERLRSCGSGRELTDLGFGRDIELAADADSSTVVPTLIGPALVDATDRSDEADH